MDKGPGAVGRMGAGPEPAVGILPVAGEAVGSAAGGMRIDAAQDSLPAWEEEQGAQAGEIVAKRMALPVAGVLFLRPVASAEVEVVACCRVAVAVGFVDPYFYSPITYASSGSSAQRTTNKSD
jgi:hypothetical protein